MVDYMGISGLQRYMLLACEEHGGSSNRAPFLRFYSHNGKPPSHHDQVNAITVSIERLIDRELLTGYGVRTRRKWFIRSVTLTAKGKRLARALLGKQQQLPLKS